MNNHLLLAVLLGVAGYLAYREFFASTETERESGPGFIDSTWGWIKDTFAFSGKSTALQAIRRIQAENAQLLYIPESLVMAIIQVESGFNAGATGAAGEFGFMQIHPVTLRWLANKLGMTDYGAYDPMDNVFFGMAYLDILFAKFADWDAVIHAYNVGPGAYDNGIRNFTYHQKVMDALNEFSN